MFRPLMEHATRRPLIVLLVVAAACGCTAESRRHREPVRVVMVSAREALNGYRVPEYRPRPAAPEPAPPRPAPRPDHRRRRPPAENPRAHPEWAASNPRAWRAIVIHHSDTDRGNAAMFNKYHLSRGWENGLGYHFVIGNGTDSADGEVEMGPRWRKQLHGAHAGVRFYNQYGIGICLVGNFEEHPPSKRQLDALVELVRYLKTTYRIPQKNILRHGDVKKTKCPGRFFPFDDLFRK